MGTSSDLMKTTDDALYQSEIEAFWRQQLYSFKSPTFFSVTAQQPSDLPAIGIQRTHLAVDTTVALQAFAHRHQLTYSSLLQGAWSLLLCRYTSENDLVFGAIPVEKAPLAVENHLELTNHTIPVRVQVHSEHSSLSFLQTLQAQWTILQEYQHPPLFQILDWSPLPTAVSLFQSIVVCEDFEIDFNGGQSKKRLLDRHSEPFVSADYPLVLFGYADAELTLEISYHRHQFADAQIIRMLGQLEMILAGFCTPSEQTLEAISILTAAERHQLLVEWNQTTANYPRSRCIHQLFEDQAQRTPDDVAVIFADRQLTYQELNVRANQFAHYLQSLGVKPESLVGISIERSLEMIIGLLGILKAGAAYIPLDPTYPADRVAYIIANSAAELLVTTSNLLTVLPAGGTEIVCWDKVEDQIAQQPTTNLLSGVQSENLAYVIYTSGSTGQPKGVKICHQSLVNFITAMKNEPGIAPTDRLLAITTICFDIHTLEIFLPLTVGACLVLASRDVTMDGYRLREQIAREQITIMQATPATWRILLAAQWPGSSGLKAICGGEALPRELSQRLLEKVGRLWNIYGPTETTVWSTLFEVKAASDDRLANTVEPIGRPIANTQIYILDKNLQPQSIGCAGELYIGGDGLARGYVQRPELDAASFVSNPFQPNSRMYKTGDLASYLPDGNIKYLGRIDHQVKIRGFRIELGEIETVLDRHPRVEQAVVIAREDTPGEKRLVAYVVLNAQSLHSSETSLTNSTADEPATSAETSIVLPQPWDTDGNNTSFGKDSITLAAQFRTFLQDKLPDYMLPSAFVILPELPLTLNGKVDRRALPVPEIERSQLNTVYVQPQNETEEAIAIVWQEVLKLDQVGIDDNFFEIGGDSLLMAQLSSKLSQVLGRQLSIVELFQYPTIQSLSQYLLPQHEDSSPTSSYKSQRRKIEQSEIAIIGMAGRFPGANTIDEFWKNIQGGINSIVELSDEELEAAGVAANLISNPNYVKAAAYLPNVAGFDAAFFGYSAKEAELTDPQQRIYLECAWEALENAGYPLHNRDYSVGVYGGAAHNTYLFSNISKNRGLEPGRFLDSGTGVQVFVGNGVDYLTTRVAYKLNLNGPAINVQTACSTSLVAVHMACQSLLQGECDMALAGGVSILVPQKVGYLYQEGLMLSADGRCHSFDAKANGTVFGDGVGIVVLKPLAQALADGDCIHAVIKGTAINNDGNLKVSFTAPSVDGQAAVIAEAQQAAAVDPQTVTYIEAHGTGTPLGDPIEVAALTQAFRTKTAQKGFCAIGSVKSNVGHLNTAAGIAGLIKTVLALKHQQLPPTLNFEQPNPDIDFANSPFYVNTRLSPWVSPDSPRRAGISSFGFGGTNAHVVLEESPLANCHPPAQKLSATRQQLLLLSAKTAQALDKATTNLATHLQQHPDIDINDVAHTLSVGRSEFNYRRIAIAQDLPEAIDILQARTTNRLFSNQGTITPQQVVFMFSGQGSQYVNMAREIYETEQHFQEQVDRCCEILLPHLGLDLRTILYPSVENTTKAAQQLQQTAITQSAIFVIEYALAQLWMSWGVIPIAMIGHSIGEYVAATLAGVFSLADALAIVAQRGRLMATMPEGSMLAVPLPLEKVQVLLTGTALQIAAINSPEKCVVSGTTAQITELQTKLATQDMESLILKTSHAFHSAMMEPMLTPFIDQMKKFELNAPTIPYISNVTGTWITAAEAIDPHYYAQHLRQTVRFADGVKQVFQQSNSVLLEVGPGKTLSSLVKSHPDRPAPQITLNSIRHPQDQTSDITVLLQTLGQLWLAGVKIDWAKYRSVSSPQPSYRIPLPTYPFEHKNYWIEPSHSAEKAPLEAGDKRDINDWFYVPIWKQSVQQLSTSDRLLAQPILVFLDRCGIGQQVVQQLQNQGQTVITVEISKTFQQKSQQSYQINPQQRDDYQRLIKMIWEAGLKPSNIMHCWSLTRDRSNQDLTLKLAKKEQELGFYSLLHLAQALGEQDNSAEIDLIVVSNHLQNVTGEERLHPGKAPLLGPVKVIGQEYHCLNCRSVDVVLSSSWQQANQTNQTIVAQLLRELHRPSTDKLLAYRGHQRWVQELETITLNAKSAAVPPLKKGGVYLITGGFGGIGTTIADHLAVSFQAKLILIGRSSLPDRTQWPQWLLQHADQDEISLKIKQVQALESQGAEVLVLAANVTDVQQMSAVVASAQQRFGHINGVIHAAGLPGGGVIQLKTQPVAASILAPKVLGTIVLQQIFQNSSLDFMLLCSSVESILGEFGQVDYVAANAFLDVYAQSAVNLKTKVISINWDAWQQVGMAVKSSSGQKNKAGIIDLETAILPTEGIEVFDRILASGLAQVVVSTRDLSTRISQIVAMSLQELKDLGNLDQPDLLATHSEITQLEKTVSEVWQQALGLNSIGLDENFFELGGDSLVAVQIMTKLRKILDENIPLATFLQAPTIKQLAALLDRSTDLSGERQADLLSWSCVVPIQRQGNKPPLFCVHPLGGNVFDYFALSQHLGSDQPFYGLQSLGLDGQEKPLQRVEDMASYYIQEIRAMQPTGPYFLSGYSFGAMIAFEMAQQLLEQGQSIGLLAFLDGSSPLATTTRPSFLKTLGIHAGNLWQLSLPERITYIKHRLDYRQNNANLRDMLISQWSTSEGFSQHLIDLLDCNIQAMDDYVAKPYAGDAVLFRSHIQSMESALDPDLSWASIIAGDLDIQAIPGAHFSLLKEPNVQVLSEKLKSYLS
jgi:amino acid adenylation domain-containing protein